MTRKGEAHDGANKRIKDHLLAYLTAEEQLKRYICASKIDEINFDVNVPVNLIHDSMKYLLNQTRLAMTVELRPLCMLNNYARFQCARGLSFTV